MDKNKEEIELINTSMNEVGLTKLTIDREVVNMLWPHDECLSNFNNKLPLLHILVNKLLYIDPSYLIIFNFLGLFSLSFIKYL